MFKMSNDKTRTVPTVSVIVPISNGENDIAKLIESLSAGLSKRVI